MRLLNKTQNFDGEQGQHTRRGVEEEPVQEAAGQQPRQPEAAEKTLQPTIGIRAVGLLLCRGEFSIGGRCYLSDLLRSRVGCLADVGLTYTGFP